VDLPEDPRERAIIGVRFISFGMILFQAHVGRLPTEEEGILATYLEPESIQGSNKWRGPYVIEDYVTKDPWGNPYHYRLDTATGLGFEVWSDGQDGQPSDDDIIASKHAGIGNFVGDPEALAQLGRVEAPHVHAGEPELPQPVPGVQNAP